MNTKSLLLTGAIMGLIGVVAFQQIQMNGLSVEIAQLNGKIEQITEQNSLLNILLSIAGVFITILGSLVSIFL